MSENNGHTESSVIGGKVFDATMGFLHKNPLTTSTKATTCRTVTPVREQAQTFIVQTIRLREDEKSGDYVFIEFIGAEGAMRLVLPPPVSDTIARQRDALTSKNRKQAARTEAIRRKNAGIQPAFMKSKKKGGKRARSSKRPAQSERLAGGNPPSA